MIDMENDRLSQFQWARSVGYAEASFGTSVKLGTRGDPELVKAWQEGWDAFHAEKSANPKDGES